MKLMLKFWFLHRLVWSWRDGNNLGILTPYAAGSTATIALPKDDKQVFVFEEDGIQTFVSFKCREVMENTSVFLVSYNNSAVGGLNRSLSLLPLGALCDFMTVESVIYLGIGLSDTAENEIGNRHTFQQNT